MSLASTLTIRPATTADAPALAALKLACFRETFLGGGFDIPYPPADLARFEVESYGPEKVALSLDDAARVTWVAQTDDGRLVAYAHAGPVKLPHEEARPDQGELYQIYILREFQSYQLGGQLMALAFEWLATHYPGPVWLGVWSGNEKAQHFYARLGFRKVGDYHFMVGDHADEEFILRRE